MCETLRVDQVNRPGLPFVSIGVAKARGRRSPPMINWSLIYMRETVTSMQYFLNSSIAHRNKMVPSWSLLGG
jgi:hypothetical protein